MKYLHNQAGVKEGLFPLRAQRFASGPGKRDLSPDSGQSCLARAWALAVPGGPKLRFQSALSCFAASLIAFAPMHAFAQNDDYSVRNRARPEFDPAGRNVGAFHLDASVWLDAAATDNVFAEEANEDSDTILSAAPQVSLQSNWARHSLRAEAGGRFENHQDFSNEDANTGYGNLSGRLDIGSRSSVSGFAGTAHEVEARTDADAPLGGDRVEYDTTDLRVGAAHEFNRIRLSGALERTEYEYDGSQAFRDNEQNVVRGRVDYAVTPRIGALLTASADEREYDNTPGINSDGASVLVGATVNFTELLVGEASVGQFNRDYDNGTTVDGLAIDANVAWYVTGLTTLTFNASRNVEDTSAVAGAQPYTESEYGARVDHELRRNVILTAGVQAGQREYDSIDRDDDFTRADVGGDYLLNRRVAIRARYTFNDVQSDGADRYRDFEENEFSIGVRFAL